MGVAGVIVSHLGGWDQKEDKTKGAARESLGTPLRPGLGGGRRAHIGFPEPGHHEPIPTSLFSTWEMRRKSVWAEAAQCTPEEESLFRQL